MSGKESKSKCAFCGKAQGEVKHLVAGPDINICDECVELCNSIICVEEQGAEEARASGLKVPPPAKIKSFLGEHVVGHAHTKKVLSVAVYNHYKRLTQQLHFSEESPYSSIEIEKSNILLIGPTGTGKTLLAQTLARMLDVPFSISDATTLTEAGYVGEDVENILLRLIQAANYDIAKAEMGIIYIDEIDKISRRTENVSITRDVSGEGVQQALLKILEGTVASVAPHGGRKHPQEEYIKINTENILFICGGAFVGLEDMIKRRKGTGVVGFNAKMMRKASAADLAYAVEPEDLIKYGLIPEFVGRMPVVSTLGELSGEDLVRILVEPKNCMVRQYQKLLAMEDIELTFTEASLKALAADAQAKKTGARGLRASVEELMLDVMYDAPNLPKPGHVQITRDMVKKRRAVVKKRTRKKKSTSSNRELAVSAARGA